MPDSSPRKISSKQRPDDSASDVDFEAAGESDGDDDSEGIGEVDPRELQPQQERSRASITTPPKGKSTPPKKVISAQRKGPATKKPATVTPIKKQQGSVKKISVPPKAPNKAMQTAMTSSNKTVGSKELEDIKAQKLPEKIQNGAKVLPISSTKSSEVKEHAPMASGVPKPVAGKDAKKMQLKKQEVTATKPSVPSAPSAARNTNVDSAKPNALPAKLANAVKITPNPSKQTIPAKVTLQKAKVNPVATVKTASAGAKKPVALKTAKAPQSSKTATSSASVDSLAKPEASSSATTFALESTLQMANTNQQTTHTTLRTSVQTSTVPYKKNPSNPSPLSSTVQTRSTLSSEAPVSIPLEALEPTRMDLDYNIGQKQFQSTEMTLGDLAETQPQSTQLPIQPEMSDAPLHTLPFSLQPEKPNLAQFQQ
jgi:hypothetical protein